MKLQGFMFVNFSFILTFVGFTLEETVDYYRQIWKDNMDAAKKFSYPTDNGQFKKGSKKMCMDFANFYDFIIIGAGTAGAVLANRLSEHAGYKILLLDAGGDESDFSLIPAAARTLQLSDMNWGYFTVPQKNACQIYKENKCNYARGKVLGGSSAINQMMYVRGNKLDFDYWENEGNLGWAYSDLLPYFIKAENATSILSDVNLDPLYARLDINYFGLNGPFEVSYASPVPTYMDAIINGYKNIGLQNLDYNGKSQIGISATQLNTRNGRRVSTNQAYLKPILNRRKNLKIITNALVTKIFFNSRKEAHKIKYINSNRCHYAHAKNEIIVSAGSINTPQLLLLSGIGPKDELKKFGINNIANLPVGQNLEDHVCVPGIPIKTNLTVANESFDNALQDFINGKGKLTYNNGLEVAFIKPVDQPETTIPEVEALMSMPSSYVSLDVESKVFNYKDDLQSTGSPPHNVINFNFVLLHPKSRGSITLKSASPIDFPNIDPNYYDDIRDRETVREGIKNHLKILNTEPFQAINASLGDMNIPECNSLMGNEFWDCIIKYKSSSLYHPSGTCRMGNNQTNSVVNSDLYIHGLKKIRIVDASVIPYITSGHLGSIVIAIAEKIADKIKMLY